MRKILIVILTTIILTTVTVCASSFADFSETKEVVNNMIGSIFTPDSVASAINNICGQENDVVVATINGHPIYKSEVEYSQFINQNLLQEAQINYTSDSKAFSNITEQYTDNETEVIKKIARRHIIIEDAKNYGIVFTHDDAMEYITNRETDLKERADSGSSAAVQTIQSDADLFKKLDMSKEEYEETILANTVIYRQTYLEAVRAYYMQIEDTNFLTYEEYIENLLADAELIIY